MTLRRAPSWPMGAEESEDQRWGRRAVGHASGGGAQTHPQALHRVVRRIAGSCKEVFHEKSVGPRPPQAKRPRAAGVRGYGGDVDGGAQQVVNLGAGAGRRQSQAGRAEVGCGAGATHALAVELDVRALDNGRPVGVSVRLAPPLQLPKQEGDYPRDELRPGGRGGGGGGRWSGRRRRQSGATTGPSAPRTGAGHLRPGPAPPPSRGPLSLGASDAPARAESNSPHAAGAICDQCRTLYSNPSIVNVLPLPVCP